MYPRDYGRDRNYDDYKEVKIKLPCGERVSQRQYNNGKSETYFGGPGGRVKTDKFGNECS